MVNVGIVILDKGMKVVEWNRWMETHSGIPAKKIIGRSLGDVFPDLHTSRFKRNFKAVISFGNFSFFSQKLHKFLFPFKAANVPGTQFDHMQQSCTMGPLRDENNHISNVFITVQDVTEVAAYEQKLMEMNIKDALTGTYNRRYLEYRLKEEYEKHIRYAKSFSLLMMDIDFFKKINDTYGHQCGDFMLQAFSEIVASAIRGADIFARYGGEEFCCLLPETGIMPAVELGDRIRKKIEDHVFEFEGTQLRITVSIGVSEAIKESASERAMVKDADEALYQAKNTGRNKVVAMT